VVTFFMLCGFLGPAVLLTSFPHTSYGGESPASECTQFTPPCSRRDCIGMHLGYIGWHDTPRVFLTGVLSVSNRPAVGY
jgi:hypothetical protein